MESRLEVLLSSQCSPAAGKSATAPLNLAYCPSDRFPLSMVRLLAPVFSARIRAQICLLSISIE